MLLLLIPELESKLFDLIDLVCVDSLGSSPHWLEFMLLKEAQAWN